MNPMLSSKWLTILLLTTSNVFMTFAWYGHLKFRSAPIWLVILASWGIAFFEYCFMIPANRWGSYRFSTVELKILQEVITLAVFSGFVVAYLGERLRWNHLAAFACILAAVAFTFLPAQAHAHSSIAGPTTGAGSPPTTSGGNAGPQAPGASQ